VRELLRPGLVGAQRLIHARKSTRVRTVASDWALEAAQLAFDGDPQVLDQVESVGDLSRLRGALAGCVRVEPIPIPGNQRDIRTIPQPRRGAGRRDWRSYYYNEERPHGAIGNVPPVALMNAGGATNPLPERARKL